MVSRFVPVAMVGRTSQACWDTRAGPPWGRAPGIYLGVRPDGYVGGPVVKRGARASLRGCIAVNFQCFKIRSKRQSACGSGALVRASWDSDRAGGSARSLARTMNLDKSGSVWPAMAKPGRTSTVALTAVRPPLAGPWRRAHSRQLLLADSDELTGAAGRLGAAGGGAAVQEDDGLRRGGRL